MALAYFIINSISILTPSTPQQQQQSSAAQVPPTPPAPLITSEDRKRMREWVLSHQHPGGGFSGSSSLVFPLSEYDEWDAASGTRSLQHSGLASIAATLFALQLLALLADDATASSAFQGVDRTRTLGWLKSLQRPDGSFGEALRYLPGQGWYIAGGNDMRFCYVAAVIRWILRGDVKEGGPGWVEDFDTQALAKYILKSQVSCVGTMDAVPFAFALTVPARHTMVGLLGAHRRSRMVSPGGRWPSVDAPNVFPCTSGLRLLRRERPVPP